MTDRSGASRGGWSELVEAPTAPPGVGLEGGPAHPFRVDAGGRYFELEVVGRGGMGQVVVARDRRLGRDVALKRIAAPDDAPALAARLAREARVTAVLEHPSIVPVYDAGVGDDGRLYYTMRLIQGRSLAEAAAETRGAHERLRLVRPFLAVCEAVAYAHSRGVVHRDLKPANVMVGPFGETQVVDWGLAAFTAAASVALRSDGGAGDTDASVGTPGYMSPEQARGAPADPRADVWSLGTMLHELVTGRRRAPSLAPTPALRPSVRAADPPSSRSGGVPAELAAIVAKATAAAPADRYPDAGVMAAEVARFLDGRRVEAHAYSTFELTRRLVRRLRVPLALAATALVVGALTVAIAFRRVTRERERAVAAEGAATTALVDGRRQTAWALTGRAMAELERGAVAEAGVLAAHALALDESPDARGVVAAALASPHPRHAETFELPGCSHVVPGSWELALCHDSTSVALWQLQPTARRWHRPLAARLVALARPTDGETRVLAVDADGGLLVLDPEDGATRGRFPLDIATGFADVMQPSLDGHHVAVTDGRAVTLIDLDARVATSGRPCPGGGVVAIGAGPARFAIVCGDGAIHLADPRDGTWRAGPILPDAAPLRPMAAALSPDGRGLVVAGLGGALVHVALDTGVVSPPIDLRGGAIMRVAYLPGPEPRVLVGTERSGATLVGLATGTIALRLPDGPSRTFRVVPEGIVAGGRQAGRWQLDDRLAPRAFVAPAGLSSVAATSDRRWIVAGRGDGRVSIWDGHTGALVLDRVFGDAVVKAVELSAAGDRLAIAVGGPGGAPQVLATGTWTPLPIEIDRLPVRRLAYTARGRLVGATYQPPSSVWSPDGARTALDTPELLDLATTPDRTRVAMLAIDGAVLLLDGDRVLPLAHAPGATAVTVWAGGAAFATGHVNSVHVTLGGHSFRLDSASRILDLAVSPDERHLLAARTDGTVAVWRLADATLVATLRGHTQRTPHVIVTPDRVALAAGWDGAVLSWNLRALDASPASLVAEVEAAWGLDLPLTLDGSRP